MNAVRFFVEVGADRVIRVPLEVELPPGPAEVIVLRPVSANGQAAPAPCEAPKEHLFDKLDRLAEQHDTSNLPSDLSENHDHYLHGLPKRVDGP